MFLKPLIDELNLTEEMDKAVLAAIVVATIKDNRLLKSGDEESLISTIIDGVCSRYMYDVCALASSWCNDLVDIFCAKIGYSNSNMFFKKTIWPYLNKNTPMPGVDLMAL